MSNFVIIFLCFILGASFKHIKRFPTSSALSLNLFIIYVSLPAMILSKFPALLLTLTLKGHWWVPVSMAWITIALAYLLVGYIGKKLQWSKPKIGALILTVGHGNTSFVGFPILEALLGTQAISIGILADQPGSFLIVSTVGILIASLYSESIAGVKQMVLKVISFPPFISLIASILWAYSGHTGDKFLQEPLDKISLTLVPLALFAVGFQTDFKWSVIKRRRNPLIIGLFFKLILFPLFFYLLYHHMLGLRDDFAKVTILESAMATMITSAVVAGEFNLDSELANLMVGLSIPLSLLTVPLFNRILF